MPNIIGSYKPSDIARYVSAAAEEKFALKASPGMLAALYATNVKASTIYLWIWNSLAASGALLCAPLAILTGQSRELPLPAGLPADIGIYIASSSTGGTYTATTTADLMVDAFYK